MTSNTALNQYRQVGVRSGVADANPHTLIKMLFDGAVENVVAAMGATQRQDLTVRSARIAKAVAIIDTLNASLDLEAGQDLGESLQMLYAYMLRRLSTAHAEADLAPLLEVQSLLGELREAWSAIPEHYRQDSHEVADLLLVGSA